MKGIILAGGEGTRLYPLTKISSKQLLPVYDKPMIYYPLSILMLGGIREIAIISTPESLPTYRKLLGDGGKLGLSISYYEQKKPLGIAHSFILCKEFISNQNVCLILGDNIFYGNLRFHEVVNNFKKGSLIFGYPVRDPDRYGVISFDSQGNVEDIVEKPVNPPSNFAVPGLYLYDRNVVKYTESLKPSPRGELEITDLNRIYLELNSLQVQILGRGIAWFDTGTSQSLFEACSFISSVQNAQSYYIGCIEEISLRQRFIDLNGFDSLISVIPDSAYKRYLQNLRLELESDFLQKRISKLQP